MLDLTQSETEQEVAIESKEIALNFDSRVARGLVVTVRALEQAGSRIGSERRVSVSLSSERPHGPVLEMLGEIAKNEIHSLERKRREFPDSDILINHLASLYVVVGDHESAASLLKQAFAQTRSPLVRNTLATTLIEKGELDAADKLLEGALGEWLLPASLSRAYICVQRGNIEKAKEFVARALEVDAVDYSARLFAGAIFIWEGAYPEAIRSLKIASEERPRSSIPLVHMAAAYFALNQRDKALSALRRATGLNPLDDRAVTFYADLLFLLSKPAQAIGPLKQIFDVWENETRQDVLDRLAKAYLDDTQHSKAIEIIRRGLVSHPDNPSLLNNAGVALWKDGRAKEAKEFLMTAATRAMDVSGDLEAEHAVPVTNLLTLLIQSEEYALAANYGRLLLQRLSTSAEPQLQIEVISRLVEALGGLGKDEEAIALAEASLRQMEVPPPNIGKLISLLLHFYSVVTLNPDRVRQLSKDAFIAIARHDVDAKLRVHCANNAVFSLLQVGDIRQAGERLGLIVNQTFKSPYVTATLGLYYLKKGDFSRGKALYDRAVQIASSAKLKARIRQRMALELAKQYLVSDERKEALYWVERAIKEKLGFDFTHREAKELKDRLLQARPH